MTDEHEPIDEGSEEVDDGEELGTRDRGRIRLGTVVGVACSLLILMGIALFSFTLPAVLDPDQARCTFAQREIEEAGSDGDDWNDVVVDGAVVDDASDLPCDDAVSLAAAIPTSEDGDDTLAIPSASTIRTSSGIAAVLGLLQAGTGLGTLMTASRAFRTAAASAGIVGTVFAVIPILPLIIGIFVVWALVFSSQAKSIWGPVRFLGGSRRSSEG